jgi:hypothetical protein
LLLALAGASEARRKNEINSAAQQCSKRVII